MTDNPVDINLVYAEEQVRPEEDFEEDIIDGMADTFETIGDAYSASLLSS
ncbi:Uncharacterised protein [Escherichia coli]|nr:Uncharacterised protein [Escherichia coli]